MYAAYLIALTMALLTLTPQAVKAEFTPDKTNPPVVAQGTGTRLEPQPQ
jgi:hypothetical protein